MIRVGKIVATHGLNGDVILTLLTAKKKWIKSGDVLFVALRKDSHIPHFVAEVKSATDKEVILRFEDTEVVEAAKKLVSKEVFVDDTLFAKAAEESPLLWIGFEAIDAKAGSLGEIEDIYQAAHQWLAQVKVNGNEALLPLIEQTLDRVDMKKKQVFLKLPDGLLDIYM